MALIIPEFLTLDEKIRLTQLGNTGQMQFMYTTNPEDRPGRDRHVVVVRDEHGHVTQDGKLTTSAFRALIEGTIPCAPAAATLDGPATRPQLWRTCRLLEYFDTVALGLRGTSPSTQGRDLDSWDRRRVTFAKQWEALDSAARRERLAEARAVLFEYHGTDAEREAHTVPTLTALHDREIQAPTAITNWVRR